MLKVNSSQGRSYRGFGGFGRTLPRAGKGPQKSFFFFFLSGIAQESVFVEKDERTPPTENKSGMARLTFEWHFSQTPLPPKKTSRRPSYVQDEAWPGANAKRRPIGRYTVELSINGERPAAQTAKWTAQMPYASCSLESCWNHYGSERAARTREKEGCQRELCVERVRDRLLAKKAIVVRRWPERDGDESAAARGRGQLFAIVPPATRTRRRKLFAVVFSDSSEC